MPFYIFLETIIAEFRIVL